MSSTKNEREIKKEDCGTEGNKEKKTFWPREKYSFSLFNKHKVSSGQKKIEPRLIESTCENGEEKENKS